MKVLWVSNSPIGPAAEILGETYSGSSGGWIQSEYNQLHLEHAEFSFLCTLPYVSEGDVLRKQSEKGTLYGVSAPRLSYGIRHNDAVQQAVQHVIDEVNPDIIHIWGTETWLSNAVAQSHTEAPKIVFIQGLIGVHQRYLGGYYKNNRRNLPYYREKRILLKGKSWIRTRHFRKQAEIEKETISLCGNVIIDSEFARAYCESISPDIRCFRHVLKPSRVFYPKQWELNKCERHSLFTIFGGNSEKGTQNLLWAVSLVKREIPDIKVYIPGSYCVDADGKLLKSTKDAFQNVLYKMISDLDLADNVFFTGKLSPEQMADAMAKCNVFVNTSCMEVHALSLREAMVVGLPCVSSLCGSVGEYLENGKNGYIYRYEEYESLAYYIKKLLLDDRLAVSFSCEARKVFRKAEQDDSALRDIYYCLLDRA